MTLGDNLHWLPITDFRAGIVSQSKTAPGQLAGVPVPSQSVGAAQQSGTKGCIALSNGGLAPLPSNTRTVRAIVNIADSYYITGLYVIGPIGPNPYGGLLQSSLTGADELIFGLQVIDPSFNVTNSLVSYQDYNQSFHTIYTTSTAQTQPQLAVSYISGGLTTIDTVAGSTIGMTESPIPGFAFNVPQVGHSAVQGVYPNPDAATSFGYYPISSSTLENICITHENRIIYLGQPTSYWPPGSGTYWNGSDEYFNFSDPPGDLNTTTFNQFETFVGEYPFSHGAWGSVSSGELFLVRHQGGGYTLSGDLNTPTATRYFGVQPTFGAVQIAAETTIGIIYGSSYNGVWSWGGGSSSSKISTQLNDDFFMPPVPTFGNVNLPTYGPSFNFVQWGDWILAPNNWLYDTTNGGWWQLPAGTPDFVFYGVGWNGNLLWAAPQTPGTDRFYVFDRKTPANTFTWTSHPITPEKVPVNYSALVREVSVTAVGNGTVTVNVLSNSATQPTTPASVSFSSTTTPRTQRTTLGAAADQLVIEITSTGLRSTDSAPVVYAVNIGYEPLLPASAT